MNNKTQLLKRRLEQAMQALSREGMLKNSRVSIIRKNEIRVHFNLKIEYHPSHGFFINQEMRVKPSRNGFFIAKKTFRFLKIITAIDSNDELLNNLRKTIQNKAEEIQKGLKKELQVKDAIEELKHFSSYSCIEVHFPTEAQDMREGIDLWVHIFGRDIPIQVKSSTIHEKEHLEKFQIPCIVVKKDTTKEDIQKIFKGILEGYLTNT